MRKFYGILSIVKTVDNNGDSLATKLYEELSSVVSEKLILSYKPFKDEMVYQIFFESEDVFILDTILYKPDVLCYLKKSEDFRNMYVGEISLVFRDNSSNTFRAYSLDFADFGNKDSFVMQENYFFNSRHLEFLGENLTSDFGIKAFLDRLDEGASYANSDTEHKNMINNIIGCDSVKHSFELDSMTNEDVINALRLISLLFD